MTDEIYFGCPDLCEHLVDIDGKLNCGIGDVSKGVEPVTEQTR